MFDTDKSLRKKWADGNLLFLIMLGKLSCLSVQSHVERTRYVEGANNHPSYAMKGNTALKLEVIIKIPQFYEQRTFASNNSKRFFKLLLIMKLTCRTVFRMHHEYRFTKRKCKSMHSTIFWPETPVSNSGNNQGSKQFDC